VLVALVWVHGLDLADHAVEVGQHLLVHLQHAGVTGASGLVDQGEGPAAVGTQLGEELRSGQEHRTGQAGVGVRAALLHRQAAVSVRQGLGRDAVAGLGPLGLRQRPFWVEADAFTLDVDLGGLLPSASDGLVGDPLWWTRVLELSECPVVMGWFGG
jgi:hypothetical protein